MPPKTPVRPPASRSSSGALKGAAKKENGSAEKANGSGNGVVITNGTPKHPHTGPQFSDNVTFVTPPPTPAKAKRQPHTTPTKPKPQRPTLLSVLLRLSLLSLLAYTFVCPSPSPSSPPPAITGPCTLLARAHSDIYTPFLAPPLSSAWASALSSPSTAPYAKHLATAYDTTAPYVHSAREVARAHLRPIILEAQSEVHRLAALLAPQLAKLQPYIAPYTARLAPALAHAQTVYRTRLRAHFLTLRSKAQHTLHTLAPHVIRVRHFLASTYARSMPYVHSALAWTRARLAAVLVKIPVGETLEKYVKPAVERIRQKVGEIREDAGEAAAPVLASASSLASVASESAVSAASEIYTAASASVSSAASVASSAASHAYSAASSKAASLSSAASAGATSATDDLAEGASVRFRAASLASSAYAQAAGVASTVTSAASAAQSTVRDQAAFVVSLAQSSAAAAQASEVEEVEELLEGMRKGVEKGTGTEGMMGGTEADEDEEESESEEDEEFERWFASFIPGAAEVGTETAMAPSTVSEAAAPATTATAQGTSPPKYTPPTSEEVAAKRADIEAAHARWEETLTAVGQGAIGRLERVIGRVRKESADELEKVEGGWKGEVEGYEREVGRVVGGVERYTAKLRKEDRSAEEKRRLLREVVEKVQGQVEKWAGEVEGRLREWWEGSEAVLIRDVEKAEQDVLDVAGDAQAELGMQYAWLEDVSTHDWTRYHDLVKKAKAYAEEYRALLYLPSETPLYRALADLTSHIEDVLLGFEARLALIHPFADAPVSGADDADPLLVQDPPEKARPRHDPLFIPGVRADVQAGTLLSKSREEVERALREAAKAAEDILEEGKEAWHSATRTASSALGATPTPETVEEYYDFAAAQAGGAAQAAYDAASGAVHDATRTIIKAAGGTPSPESLKEHYESVVGKAKDAAGTASSVVESAYGAATSNVYENVHQATRAAHRAVGGTPTPESVEEYYDFAAAQAGGAAQAAYDAASGAVHDATRTIIKAAGGTPSPEGVREHLESVRARVQDGSEELLEKVEEILSSASAAIEDVAGEATGLAESFYEAGSSAVHRATRTAIKAAGGTPSPETFGEHVESLKDAASQGIHQATRSVIKAAGGTPSPESLKEHYESVVARATDAASAVSDMVSSVESVAFESASSLASVVSDSATSLASVVSDSASSAASVAYDSGSSVVHHATRTAMTAVGATPSPENLSETVSSLSARATDTYASVASVIESLASDASDTYTSVTDSVKSAAGVETAKPLTERALSSAASVLDSLASGASSATDSVKSAAGVETAKPVTERASSSVVSAASSISSAVSSVFHQEL